MRIIGSYFIVSDLARSIEFYTNLLQFEPTLRNGDRWAEWLWAGGQAFFGVLVDSNDLSAMLNVSAVAETNMIMALKTRPTSVLNVFTPDIQEEYRRCQSFVGKLCGTIASTPEPAIGATGDYICFLVYDPDGNRIEVFHSKEDECITESMIITDRERGLSTKIISKSSRRINTPAVLSFSKVSSYKISRYEACDFCYDDLVVPSKIIMP